MFNSNGSSAATAAATASTPALILGTYDPSNTKYGCRLNGGAWALLSVPTLSGSYGNKDVTAQIGAWRSDLGFQWFGHIYDVLIFADAFSDPSNVAKLAIVEATLKARHMIP